jgi:hypothetical protein
MIATLLLIGFGASVPAGFCYALCAIASSADDRMERLLGDLVRVRRREAAARN